MTKRLQVSVGTTRWTQWSVMKAVELPEFEPAGQPERRTAGAQSAQTTAVLIQSMKPRGKMQRKTAPQRHNVATHCLGPHQSPR